MCATSYRSILLLLVGCLVVGRPARARAAEHQTYATLAGIFMLSDVLAPRRSTAAETVVTRRLHSLDITTISRHDPEPCREASCLPTLAARVGVDIAITGSVYRSIDLCTANLWVYDRRTDTARSADIRCQPGSSDDLVAAEFADQVGRLSEPPPRTADAGATAGLAAAVSIAPPPPSIPSGRLLLPGGWRRQAAVSGLGILMAGFLGASIVSSSWSTADPDDRLYALTTALWGATAASGIAFAVKLANSTERK